MRKLLHITSFALAAMISAATPAIAMPTLYQWEEISGIATPAEPVAMDGNTSKTLADFKGQVVLLNIWASWCTPCLKELPALDTLEENYAKQGLVVLPVSLDTMPYKELRSYVDNLKLELPHLAQDADGKFMRALKPTGVPVSYLIDRSGTIRYRYTGATDWANPDATKTIDDLLAESKSR
jgi:thiol-disulfide isomerase/thioredoxin